MVDKLLHMFNTMTREIELFRPHHASVVEMYTCGPSIYQRPHIGNYRTFIFEDILHRYLEYLGYDVVRLITLTDVEDKALAQADKEKTPLNELSQRNEQAFFDDARLLRMAFFSYVARSSETVEQATKLIDTLLKKGVAYRYMHAGRENIYYDPLQFREFGKLSKLNRTNWPAKKRRFHLDTYHGTPWNKGDFILWHGCKETDDTCWDTEIGRGRPSWNVQDAAMVTKNMGFRVDIACGGIDNLVRHHDYTIAVAEAVSGKEFAKYWFHCHHLLIDGKKMSKSKGNVHHPRDLLKRGYKGEHIRFFLAYGHYRKRLNFTFERFAKTSQMLDAFRSHTNNLGNTTGCKSCIEAKQLVERIITSFKKHLNDDLHVEKAIDELFTTLTRLNKLRQQGQLSVQDASLASENLKKIDQVLQVIF